MFDLDERLHSKDATVIFPAPTSAALKLSYGVTGGEIRLSSQRWISVSSNASIVEFFKDSSENYTKLIMPEAVTKSVAGSYLMADGYAGYHKASTDASYMATYTLACEENSTRYGVISEEFMSATDYPFLVFSDGALIEGAATLKLAVSIANKRLAGSEYADSRVEILMRADFDNTDEISFGSTNGTVLIDLGGKTLARTKTIINAVINSNTVYDYETSVIFTNGRINAKSNSPIGVTHYLADTTEIKTFDITFDKVTFGFDAGFTVSSVSGVFWNFWHNDHKVNTVTNLTYKDCSFDLEANAPASGGTLITIGNAYADANINILGGDFVTNGAAYTFAKTDAEDTLTAGIGSDGELPSLKVKAGGASISDNFKTAEGEYTNFTTDGTTEGDYDIYTLTVNNNVTDYGVIPTAKADADAYPFLLFSGGEFISAHATWNSVTASIGSLLHGKPDADAQILLRKDYTNTGDAANSGGFNKANGTLTVDLGGFTFTRDKVIFDFYYGNTNTSPANIVIKNGSLRTLKSPIFANQIGTATSDKVKQWNVTLEKVTLGFAPDAVRSGEAFFGAWTNPTKENNVAVPNTCTMKSNTNITLNDCVLDLKTNLPSGDKPVLFDFTENYGYTDLINNHLVINGGEIICDNISNVILSSLNTENDSVTFGKYNGKYTYMTAVSNAKDYLHGTTSFNTTEGKRYFIEVKDDGTKSTYELLPMTFGDKTAYINEGKNLSAVDYPFFVFEDTAFKSANTSWSAALGAARDLLKDEGKENTVATIVLRYEYTSTAGSNFNAARGKIVVDLNGYTLESTTYIGDCGVNFNNTSYLGKSTIEFKNGTIVNNRIGFNDDGSPKATLPLFGLQHSNGDSTKSKALDFCFTDVTFRFIGNSKYMVSEFDGKTGGSLVLGYYFDNCTVDFTGAPSGARLLDCNDNKNNMTSTVVFTGGSVMYPDLTNYKLANMRSDESLAYERCGGGEYTAIILPATVTAPTHTSFVVYNAAGKALTLGKESVSGTNTVYRLGEAVATEYGEIPYTYADANAYPFAVFNEQGGFIAGDDTFLDITDKYENDGALNVAKEYMKGNVYADGSYGDNPRAAFILMRRDYAMASNEQYNNVAQIQGTLTVDFGGFTLTAPSDRVAIPFSIKPWGGSGDANIFPTEIVMKNGGMVLTNRGIVSFAAWTGNNKDGTTYPDRDDYYMEDKEVSLKFVDVGFSVKGTATSLVYYYQDSNTPNATANTHVSYENCRFDVTSADKSVKLFDSGNGKIHSDTSVLGCEIKAASLDKFTLSSTEADSVGGVMLGRSTDGKLLAITLDKSAEAPSGDYLTALGAAEFIKESENTLTATYRLRVKALSDFTVKSSISLYSDLRYNIYVSNIAALTKLTLNGTVYEGAALTSLPITDIGGTAYYTLTVSLSADAALADMVLLAEVDTDGGTLGGRYTMSLVKYVENATANNAAAAEEKLLLDILSYVRSAYAYFGKTDSDLAVIDEILGTDYDADNTPTLGTAVTPEAGSGIGEATFVLGAVPSVRFYLDGTVTDSSEFEFKQGSRTLEFTVGTDTDGDYLEVTSFAYVLAGDIEFTVDGTAAGGAYNLAAYYDFVVNEYSGEKKAELKTLVERFMCYAQSAEAYRNARIG